MYIPPYNSNDFKTSDTGFHHDGLWIRPGIIQAVDSTTGLVDIEWLDHPGVRQAISITQPHQGMYQIPTPGAIVLVGFDQGFGAQILRYLPAGYAKQISDGTLYPQSLGELMLISYLKDPDRTQKFAVPSPTGTKFYMNNVGDIEMATAEGELWQMKNADSEIAQSSMNYTVSTEAGMLQFGLVKRPDLITTAGVPIESSFPGSSPNVLTEFRLRLLDKADANPDSAPEVNDPFIELTMGVKVDDGGNIVKTGSSHASTISRTPQEIIIQLKTKADQGFEFAVDREGNVTLRTRGNMKIDVGGDTHIDVGGNANVNVVGGIMVDAKSIRLAGDQSIVLSNFLSLFDSHFHTTPQGPSGPPNSPSTSVHVSTKVKVS